MARRGKEQPTNALVAAATHIKLDQPSVAAKQAAKRQEWQTEGWTYFDEVPELKEAVWYRGNQLGKVRLYCAVENPDDPNGTPIPVDSPDSGVPEGVAQQAVAELARLASTVGGQSEIQRELDMNLEVAGECYLVGFGERAVEVTQRDGTVQVQTEPENWEIKSISEVEVKGSGKRTRYLVKADPDDRQGVELDQDQDTIIRIWLRHPQWSNRPDSPMRGLLGECRILQVLTQQVQAEANSRQSAGFFTVPNELSFGPADTTQPEDGHDGEPADPFMEEMTAALTEPIHDPSAASSVMPMLIRGPGEYLKSEYLRHITLGRDTSESLEARIEARLTRIFRGMNLPVEKITGHQETTYANAAQVDEDEYNDYFRPSADTMCDALTAAFLNRQLAENPQVPPEWTDGQIFIAPDPTPLIRQPDPEVSANDAFDRFAIGWESYRKAKGYSEDDAPSEDEMLAMAGLRRGIFTAQLTVQLLERLGVDIDMPAEDADDPQALPPGDDQDGEAVAALGPELLQHVLAQDDLPADQRVVAEALLAHLAQPAPPRPAPLALSAAGDEDPTGRQLTAMDRELRTRLNVAADDAMTRALERAGNRLRSKTNGTEYRQLLRNVPARHSFAHLGRTLVAQVLGDDDPLAGAWDDLERQFRTWGEQAQEEAMELASRVASGFSLAERNQLGLRQAEDLDRAWEWMEEALTALADARMFDPDPKAPDVGEFDPTLTVPTGMVRQALARAGGATGLVETDPGAWIALVEGGHAPAGGIGTGQLVTSVMREHGAQLEAYRWVYGPAFRQRPFEPHRRLDGTVFQNFDDDVLINGGTFPPYSHYMPGDHTGCICDFEPIIIPADQVT